MKNKFIVIIIQLIVVFTIITIITLFLRYNNAIKLEKRVAKYSVRNTKKYDISFFDKVKRKYIKFIIKQRPKIKKLFPSVIKRYNKYIFNEKVKAEDYIIYKFSISLIFLVLAITIKALNGKIVSLFQLLVSFFIGFYIFDLYLVIKKRLNNKKIEDDILRALIVMNNAFKSGKSIIQAVSLVPTKIDGIIGVEFKKIEEELKYGLSVEKVFNRFAKRIKIEEAEYLSSSLTILNKTGGNIIAVFDSIEKTLIDKKKLKEELKNATSVSNLVVKILLVVPIILVIIIYMFDNTYFTPFFNTTLGNILFGIIIIMFVIYAYLLDKIVKVKY